jgi:hypothetical protein
MAKEHPHTGATRELIVQQDGSFAVKVTIPGSHPTMVTGFASKASAQAWMASHKRQVATGNDLRLRTLPPPALNDEKRS